MSSVHRHPVRHAGRLPKLRGFTLVELMVTIAIVAILAMVAVPSFQGAMLSSKLNTLANNFVASAQLARSEAIKRNATVTLCASTDSASCSGSWNNGWLVFHDANDNDAVDASEVIYTQVPFPDGFVLIGNVTSIDFKPTGVGATAANLTLCRNAPTVGNHKRTVTVSATGRPGVKKVVSSRCP